MTSDEPTYPQEDGEDWDFELIPADSPLAAMVKRAERAELRLAEAEKLSDAVKQWDIHDAVAYDGHLQAGIEWASWTWLKAQLAALAPGAPKDAEPKPEVPGKAEKCEVCGQAHHEGGC